MCVRYCLVSELITIGMPNAEVAGRGHDFSHAKILIQDMAHIEVDV